MRKIFIDAGHNDSGWNTGAVGNGLKEQDITFAVASLLGEILSSEGFEIKLSRPIKETNLGTNNSSSINARYTMANNWGTDLFISIHCNSNSGIPATGTETLYYRSDALNLAAAIQLAFRDAIGLASRGVKYRTDIGVIRYTNMPSVLIELGFINNAADAAILINKQPGMAQAIAQGVYNYLGHVPKEKEDQFVIEKLNVLYNGANVAVDSINKDGLNYVKLRDLEKMGLAVGYDMDKNIPTVAENVQLIHVMFNGEAKEAECYNIAGYNYIKLREVEKLNLSVGFDDDKGMPVIMTKE